MHKAILEIEFACGSRSELVVLASRSSRKSVPAG